MPLSTLGEIRIRSLRCQITGRTTGSRTANYTFSRTMGVGGQPNWWSQTGSNRRPHACKARALPTELWPLSQRRAFEMVGLGRLELPTSRLSSARSNQLSYKPPTASQGCGLLCEGRTDGAVLVREERETKTAVSRQMPTDQSACVS
jgi:hypothetical protein